MVAIKNPGDVPKTEVLKAGLSVWWRDKSIQEKAINFLILILFLGLTMAMAFLVFKPNCPDPTIISMPLVDDVASCGDWTRFKNEKCFKVVASAGRMTQEDAEEMCHNTFQDLEHETLALLMTVKTQEEQDFVQHLLSVQNGVAESAWLGLKRANQNGSFKWNDGANAIYTNWANNNVTASNHQCVQMKPGSQGYWYTADCYKMSAVVCERPLPWSLSKMQVMLQTLLQKEKSRNSMEGNFVNEMEFLKELNAAANETLSNLEKKNKAANDIINVLILNYHAASSKINALEKINEAALRKIALLEQKYESAVKNVDDLENKTEEHGKKLASVEQYSKLSQNKIFSLKEDYEVAVFRINAIEKANNASADVLSELKRSNEAVSSNMTALQQQDEASKHKLDHLSEITDLARKKIAALELRSEASSKTVTASNSNNETTVPIGFMYIQLPGKQPPTSLWPKAQWKDVSSEYAGLFFRAEGGNSAPFGELQEDNTRRFAQAAYAFGQPHYDPIIPSDGSWSKYAYTGIDATLTGTVLGMRFRLTTGEVRPRNKAVKIWQRIK